MSARKPQILVSAGLFILSGALALRAIGPAFIHTDLGDGILGFFVGLGLVIEIAGVVQLRKARRG